MGRYDACCPMAEPVVPAVPRVRALPTRPSEGQISALAAELRTADPALRLVAADQLGQLERFSRDFFDYSPVLIPQLQGQRAQLVAMATTVDQVRLVAGACSRHRVPLTVRGAGTGNYGQCVPLCGGLVLDLTGLERLRSLDVNTGVLEVEAGMLMGELERQLAAQGRALRLVPSTVRSATIGGFIAGGSGGIGSLRWGFLRDPGNLLGLEVVTLEPEPRLLRLDAAASEPLNHAYGTNGILTALRLPTCAAIDWVQVVVGFRQWQDALAVAQALLRSAFELQALTLLDDAVVPAMPWPLDCAGPAGEQRLLLLAAPGALEPLVPWLESHGGQLLHQQHQSRSKGIPLRELCWNHTTLHWRAAHPGWTYLQLLLPQPEGPCLEELRRRWGEAIRWHLEAVKHQGAPRLACLPLVRWQGEEQLERLIADCRELGAFLFNPHVLTVEDGGLGVVDADQVAAKHAHDPAGLLNPGKLRGWVEGL
jgi:FAD/FMN-containing dehydrogenase